MKTFNRLFAILICLGLAGCMTDNFRRRMFGPNSEEKAQALREEMESQRVEQLREQIEANRIPVTEKMDNENYRAEFVKYVCKLTKVTMKVATEKKKCEQMFREAFLAKLREEYPNSFERLGPWCAANPLECSSDLASIERRAKSMNREEMERMAHEEQAREELVRAQNQALRNQRTGRVIQAIGNAFKIEPPKKMNCTSTSNGYSVNTECQERQW